MKIKLSELRQLIKSVIKEERILKESLSYPVIFAEICKRNNFKFVSPNQNDKIKIIPTDNVLKNYKGHQNTEEPVRSNNPNPTLMYEAMYVIKAGGKVYDELINIMGNTEEFVKNVNCTSLSVANYLEIDKKYPQFKGLYELSIIIYHLPSVKIDISGFKGQIL